jgi:hypothetical protein
MIKIHEVKGPFRRIINLEICTVCCPCQTYFKVDILITGVESFTGGKKTGLYALTLKNKLIGCFYSQLQLVTVFSKYVTHRK